MNIQLLITLEYFNILSLLNNLKSLSICCSLIEECIKRIFSFENIKFELKNCFFSFFTQIYFIISYYLLSPQIY